MTLRLQLLFVGCVALLCLQGAGAPSSSPPPTFYRDVLPIVQSHCQSCHRQGEIAPMPLETYQQVKARARAIRDAVESRKMPPWFADPCCGTFSNDTSLNATELQILKTWADSNTPEGDRRDASAAVKWTPGWNIPQPDATVAMPKPVPIPDSGDVPYTYEIVPTNFAEDRWVQMSEVRPTSRAHVHHAVVYIRPPDSDWLKGAPVGVPFTSADLKSEKLRHDAHSTTNDMLLVYAPGSSPDRWRDGMAKFIPAHSDLVFQMHYTTNGHAANDRTSVGMVFAKKAPAQRVITLQLANDHDPIAIPARAENYRVEVH